MPSTPSTLTGRTLWIPRMSHSAARLFAAVFRGCGIDSRACEITTPRAMELGLLHTGGEECYPTQITLGDFLSVLETHSPETTAFMMPTAEGPCRFGQYSHYLRTRLEELGHHDIPILSPSSKDGYDAFGEASTTSPLTMVRMLWRGIVSGDILRKMLLKTRPYETEPGRADKAFEESLHRMEAALEAESRSPKQQLRAMVDTLEGCRDLFRAVPANYQKGKPLIGVVGEIFCRLNAFSNHDACRTIEAAGGECWLSDITEWVWYTNWGAERNLRRRGKRFSLRMFGTKLKHALQRRDEHALLAPFADDFAGYEEPHDIAREILEPAETYLPARGCIGEMVLSAGKAAYLHTKGADGIIDISPFGCMNGIITEAIYPDLSADHANMPIRNFYFDASSSTLERDLEIFMELARTYQGHKPFPRRYPASFS
ncbi:MAG: hypothetical protein HN909_01750 [Phycisphaerales bacterium]|nr:hypothetical protein [Phycisphaerales bacterium]MBT7170473.1 hypothetical protein [Phycisphaerales bacterium]